MCWPSHRTRVVASPYSFWSGRRGAHHRTVILFAPPTCPRCMTVVVGRPKRRICSASGMASEGVAETPRLTGVRIQKLSPSALCGTRHLCSRCRATQFRLFWGCRAQTISNFLIFLCSSECFLFCWVFRVPLFISSPCYVCFYSRYPGPVR
jgi:hypothetical protein